jgi:hypothetical protein
MKIETWPTYRAFCPKTGRIICPSVACEMKKCNKYRGRVVEYDWSGGFECAHKPRKRKMFGGGA